MVAPVTNLGFVNTDVRAFDGYGYSYSRYYERQNRHVQKKPFDLVLPYTFESAHVVDWRRSAVPFVLPGTPMDAQGFPSYALPNFAPLLNSSYERLRGKLYDKVGAGVNFAESNQSVSMISSTATTLARSFLAVKRGQFGVAAEALRMKFIPKGVSPLKSAGNNFLEFHFGWKPLLKDIHDGLEVLVDPVKSFACERASVFEQVELKGSITSGSTFTWGSRGVAFAKQGCRVKTFRPGPTQTLHQWGLDNPLLIAWELVPFSFVIDWFVNVGDVLSSLTDFAGMTLVDQYRTYGTKLTFSNSTIQAGGIWYASSQMKVVKVYRVASLSGVELEVRKIKPPSITRATTAISLLLQGFK
jgi:hypothetical protein